MIVRRIIAILTLLLQPQYACAVFCCSSSGACGSEKNAQCCGSEIRESTPRSGCAESNRKPTTGCGITQTLVSNCCSPPKSKPLAENSGCCSRRPVAKSPLMCNAPIDFPGSKCHGTNSSIAAHASGSCDPRVVCQTQAECDQRGRPCCCFECRIRPVPPLPKPAHSIGEIDWNHWIPFETILPEFSSIGSEFEAQGRSPLVFHSMSHRLAVFSVWLK